MFAAYLRLRLPTSASDIDVIRAAYARFDAKLVRENRRVTRAARHKFYREMLALHAASARVEGYRSH